MKSVEVFNFIEPGVLSDGDLTLRLSRKVVGDLQREVVPTYHFEMLANGHVAGAIRFRAGTNSDIELYAGNLGYNVDPEFRGRHYAERACKLLLPFAAAHGFDVLWITCDPENGASRRTCDRLGATLVEVVTLPGDNDMHQDGERQKCRYRLELR